MFIDRTLRSLTERMESLAPAEQRVARYILDHPEDSARLTVGGLAAAADSSVATVVRVCKKAGFAGFPDFKMHLVRDLASPLASGYDEVDPDDSRRVVVRKMFAASIASLQETGRLAESQPLHRAVEYIEGADEVTVFGVGTSAYIALDAARRLMRAGVRVSAETSGVDQTVRAALLGRRDLVIAVSNSGATSELIDAVITARTNGAAVVTVTHAPHSPLANISDVVLTVAAQESAYDTEAMAARLATLALLDALFVVLAMRRHHVAEANLHRINRAVTGHDGP
ncbi:MAG TPA: MurR/RpiR family transcriptional regulator [Streptosporangiaceae bacterium]